jgi:hypothetical protein
MKYCPRCKLRMPTEQNFCQKCGGSLRTIGGAAAPGEPAPAAGGGSDDLALQLVGLQHEVQKSRRTLFAFGVLAIILSVFLVGLLTGLHFYRVSQFAEVGQLDVSLSEDAPGEASIEFERNAPGKIEFLREADGRTETLIDHGGLAGDFLSSSPRRQFTWSGGDNRDFVIRIRTRNGWSVKEQTWAARGGKISRVD